MAFELYDMLHKVYDFRVELSVTIELVGHQLWAPNELSHLKFENPFHSVWEDRVMKQVMDILKKSPTLSGNVCSIDQVRSGFDLENLELNPIAISLTVDGCLDPPD